MRQLAMATYLLAVVYVANVFMLSAIAGHEAGRTVWLFKRADGTQRLISVLLWLACAAALVWPGVRLWGDGLGQGDPVTRMLQGSLAAITGHLLVAVSAAVALLSQYHMGASWRVGATKDELGPLVETGPFALSRNPVFLGQGLLLVGLVLAYPDLIELTAALLALTLLVVQTHIEEAVLRATHGKAYEAYAARVPRWIGSVHRGAALSSGQPYEP